ncbi:MAG: hypothetical protein KDK36_16325 [Leptospiraceae bacterium]|nr:hypothetical protein [Leptospiraceae bacterium]
MSGTYNAGVYPHEKLGDKNAANCAMGIFPYFVFGDLSVYHAAKKAGIDKIHLVEYKMDSTFLWFNKCVYVYGE